MLIDQEEILRVTGYTSVGCAEKALRAQGVRFIYGKDGQISTTLNAIEHVLMDKPPEKEKFEIDD